MDGQEIALSRESSRRRRQTHCQYACFKRIDLHVLELPESNSTEIAVPGRRRYVC